MRKVCSIAPRTWIYIGYDEYYMPRMYSLALFLSSGHSEGRIMYSRSWRCIRNGTQARPDSIQITGSLGKRSPMPLITQFVHCRMLYQVKPSACAERKRLQLL